MEEEREYETVYYVNAPFTGSEEEIGTSYVINNNDFVTEEIVFIDENGQIVQNDEQIVILHEDINDFHEQIIQNQDACSNENETCAEGHQSSVMEHEISSTMMDYEENQVAVELPDNSDVAENQENLPIDNPNIPVSESQEVSVGKNSEDIVVEGHSEVNTSNENEVVKQLEAPQSAATGDCEDSDTDSEEERRKKKLPHQKAILPEGTVLDKHTCAYCLRRFNNLSNKARHCKDVHNIQTEGKSTYIKCIECNISFATVQRLRNHLEAEHSLSFPLLKFKFPNLEAFKKWKHETEKKDLSCFTMRHGTKRTPSGVKYFYICHRSGIYHGRLGEQRKRMLKTAGTCKLGIVCTAAIYAEEHKGEISVKYCPHHYGHGKETSFVQLSTEEQNAIQENVSAGVPFESLLDDIRDSQSADHFTLYLIKKRDIKFINTAFASEEYNPGLSDAESVDRWVRLCCQMEDSPILFYRQEETAEGGFLLIIMTEFQKQILMSAEKQIVCVDSLFRRKGSRFYLTCIFIMDEYEKAFPVAFCISHKVDKQIMTQFYTSIKESTGPLSCTYFMSDSEKFYYDSWVDVMEDNSCWLWSMWYVDYCIRVQLRIFKGETHKRAEAYKTMRMLLECQNPTVFDTMFKNYLETLAANPQTRALGAYISQKYGSCKDSWALCYHKNIKFGTIIHLEVLHRTLRYCCREGRKKRLDKFIIVLMKLVRYKMLDRLNSDLDDDKVKLVVEAIDTCHNIGLEISTEHISSLSDKIWLIRSEEEDENVYVTQDFTTCPEHCSLKCSECDICVHMFSCSCMHSMINANLCQHIHAVVWKFLTPHFSPPCSPSGGGDDFVDEEVENVDTSVNTGVNPEKLIDAVLSRTHGLYKKIRSNKNNLNREALTAIMKRLDESFDIALGKPVPDTPGDFKNPVIVVNSFKSPVLQNQTNPSQNPQTSQSPLPSTPLQPNQPQSTQPTRFTLPNQIQNMLNQNKQGSQYVLLLPNSSFIQK